MLCSPIPNNKSFACSGSFTWLLTHFGTNIIEVVDNELPNFSLDLLQTLNSIFDYAPENHPPFSTNI